MLKVSIDDDDVFFLCTPLSIHSRQFGCHSFDFSNIITCFDLLILTIQGTDARGEKNVAATGQESGKQGRQTF